MDEFRKPYEYMDEEKGLILLFVVMLLAFDLIQAPMYIVPVYGYLRHTPSFSIIFLIISIPYVLFILYTAVTCLRLKKDLVIIAKIYLITRLFFLSFCISILYLNDLKTKTLSGKHYSNTGELTLRGLVLPLSIDFAFSIIWFLYFIKSKRCKEIAKKNA